MSCLITEQQRQSSICVSTQDALRLWTVGHPRFASSPNLTDNHCTCAIDLANKEISIDKFEMLSVQPCSKAIDKKDRHVAHVN